MAALDVNALKDRAVNAYKAFTAAQLVLGGLLLVVTIVGGIYFMSWVTAPSYVVLTSGVTAKDAADITAKLTSDGVAYKLTGGGTTIMVPQSKLDTEHIALAAAGLPKGTSGGWDIINKEGLTTSSFRQQVDYQQALEGEIAGTLQSMDGISTAQVHLVMPQQSLYSDTQQPARASVMLTTSSQIASSQVKSVVQLVASAVPNLDANNVTVTDSEGHLLSSEGGGSSDQVAAQASYEDALAAQAQSMLDSVLGVGKSVVRINAVLDSSSTDTTTKTVDTTKSAPASSTTSNEQYTGAAANNASGQLTGTNTTSTTSTNSPSALYTKSATSTTMDNGEQLQHNLQPPGAVKRLTVSVAVDASANAPTAPQLEKMIGNAVGYDTTRGDALTVTNTPFAASTAIKSAKPASGAKTSTMVSTAVAGAMLLIITLLLARSMRRPKVTAVDLPADLAGQQQLAAAGNGRGALTAGGSPTAVGAGTGPRALPAGGESILGSVDDRGDEVALLLRGWLSESDSVGAGGQNR
jgi:flagellar M-ring protein FliF